MRIPGRRALLSGARLARSRLVRRGIILGYHRVNNLPWDPFHQAVSPENFTQQLAVLRRHANVLSLPELAAAHAAGEIPPRSVVITFDDGYSDYLTIARPYLVTHDFPSTLFIATGYIGREFWWDTLTRLAGALDPVRPLQAGTDGARFSWPPQDASATPDRDTLLRALYRFLMALETDARVRCLDELVAEAGLRADGEELNLALTEAEISGLAADAQVDIGAHTVSHSMLAPLPAARQHEEILQSRQTLQRLTGRPVNGFSYPHGSTGGNTQRLVRECGFTHACASHKDVVWRNSDPLCLPRIWIPDCPGAAFTRLLKRWL